jgi:hypothetical protein
MAQKSTTGEFYWWFGVVEDRMDPYKLGRVRVRILNSHSPYTADIKVEDLPWANVIMPATSASVCGIGTAPVGLVEGSFVFGFFRDGHLGQLPVVIGTWHGIVQDAAKDIGYDVKQTGNAAFGKVIQKNNGDGFRDQRTEEELKKFPKKIKKLEVPDGKDKQGDDHGIQIEDEDPKKYPTDNFKGKSDVSPIAINDKDGLKDTIYEYKTKKRSEGGLIDDGFVFINMIQEPFKCGITNESKISLVKLNNLGVLSTSKNSLGTKWKPFSETPPALDDGGKKIYDEKSKI